MFKNWKRIAQIVDIFSNADAPQNEKRAVEHRVDYLRAERVKMLKERDALKADVARLQREHDALFEQIKRKEASANSFAKALEKVSHHRDRLTERLDRIAAMETPNANGTVRRMARVARGDDQ